MKLHTLILSSLAFAGAAGTLALSAHAEQIRGNQSERLEALDTDGDGDISRAEVDTARQARFAEADANGDGAISEAEFTTAMEARASERRARRQASAFTRADANGDGVISMDETGGRIDAMFEHVDADGDGIITAAEREVAKSAMRERSGEGRRGRRGPPVE